MHNYVDSTLSLKDPPSVYSNQTSTIVTPTNETPNTSTPTNNTDKCVCPNEPPPITISSSESHCDIVDLPNFQKMANPVFTWGPLDGPTCVSIINKTYDEAVCWKPNLFRLPSGRVGESFVQELTHLFHSYATSSALESIALKAAYLLPILVLQKSSSGRPKGKVITSNIDRRLSLWREGSFVELLQEGRAIQSRLSKKVSSSSRIPPLARSFANSMMNGKVNNALHLLSNKSKGKLLSLDLPVDPSNPSQGLVRDVLNIKHPPPGAISSEAVHLNHTPSPNHDPHFASFDCIDGDLIHKISLRTSGAAGPSGVDAKGWRRLCSSFKSSPDLCSSLAALARRLCTSYVDPAGLSAFVASRLIALDKSPGVRPVGIGETSRRIVSKAILLVLRQDVIDCAGSLQLCAGQDSGCEAAVHAVRQMFEDDNTEALLLVDADNAFNSLNREVALRNILHSCPSLGRVLINTYREGANLFINGESITSQEGTTQGDPMAMAMYALGTKPLINRMKVNDARQVWYADDCTASGSLCALSEWWNKLTLIGPQYGYFPKATKTCLLVKPQHLSRAQQLFSGTDLSIVTDGGCVLGAPIGTPDYVSNWMRTKVQTWIDDIDTLSDIAKSQPHSAHSALTHGLISRWTYSFRTCPNTTSFLEPLEKKIHTSLIPALTSQKAPSDTMRSLFSLPSRLGGLGISNPIDSSSVQYHNSITVTAPMVDLILKQTDTIPPEVFSYQSDAKNTIHNTNITSLSDKAMIIYNTLPPSLQRLVDMASEKGSSAWLTALPLRDHGYNLHKSAFKDGLCLRYGWTPPSLPNSCVCGTSFTINHALNCPCGGLPSLRHNELRDLTANLLREVCPQVTTEPSLQPLTGESIHPKSAIRDDNARSDVKADGFWSCQQQSTYFDIKVFNPTSKSYLKKPLPSLYRTHEQSKRRDYEDRIIHIEHGTFSPLVFSTSGGMGPIANTVFSRIASMISSKTNTTYSKVVLYIRTKISFALIRSAIRCLRGSRSTFNNSTPSHNIQLALSEGRVTY